jgi:hypothetical protein
VKTRFILPAGTPTRVLIATHNRLTAIDPGRLSIEERAALNKVTKEMERRLRAKKRK